MNPFKFGTVVDEPFFIDRKDELVKIDSSYIIDDPFFRKWIVIRREM